MSSSYAEAMQAHYALGEEAGRLDEPFGVVEFTRTKEIVERHLPAAPATVADIGGGPGRYSLWLAELGYAVEHRDLAPGHVDYVRDRAPTTVHAAIGDARALDLADDSVDAVLLLGPLYHLHEEADRVAALREAGRVAKPGAPVFAAVISRYAARLHGVLAMKLYRDFPDMPRLVAEVVEPTGDLPPLAWNAFVAYTHRPQELVDEVHAAGLELVDLVGVEGMSFALPDLADRLADDVDRGVVLDSARAIERVPELLGLSPHLLVTARAPS